MSIMDEPSIRVVSGSTLEVELLLNELAGNYSPLVWNFTAVGERLVMSVVMVHEREVRKSAIAMAAVGNAHGGRRIS